MLAFLADIFTTALVTIFNIAGRVAGLSCAVQLKTATALDADPEFVALCAVLRVTSYALQNRVLAMD